MTKILKPQERVCKDYGIYEESVFNDDYKKISQPEECKKSFCCNVCNRDIDINDHVNNLCYLDFAEEALPTDVEIKEFSLVQIDYKHPLFLKDKLTCSNSIDNNSCIIIIKSNEQVNALAKFSP